MVAPGCGTEAEENLRGEEGDGGGVCADGAGEWAEAVAEGATG